MDDLQSIPNEVFVDLPMSIFLRIADSDGKMTARELECFNDLIENHCWCSSQILKRVMNGVFEKRSELWKQYAAEKLRPNFNTIVKSLDRALAALPDSERTVFAADLVLFSKRLLAAANRSAGLLRTDKTATSVYQELFQLLTVTRTPTSPQAEQSQSRETPEISYPLGYIGPGGSEGLWNSTKFELKCIQLIDETHDVRTLRFVSEPPGLFHYKPGQFVTLNLNIDGTVVRRSYTISSSPSRPYSISITVKRVEGGRVSNWIHDNLKVGAVISAEGPYGKFSCIGDIQSPLLFLSGGSGITPVMSMTRWLQDTMPERDIVFLHFARSPADFIFERELGLYQKHSSRMKCIYVCSRASKEEWDGPMGRISSEILPKLVPDIHARSAFLCGPVPFMTAAQEALQGIGFDMSRFSQESFGGASPSKKPRTGRKPSDTIKVSFSESGLEKTAGADSYLLDVALESGIDIPYSCRAGQCGTCKVILLSGKVEQDSEDALSGADKTSGYILACQARAIDNVVVKC